MTTRPGARIRVFRSYLVLAAALCAVIATLTVPTSAAAAKKSVSLSQFTNLEDQVIKVSWQGFHPTMDDGTYGVVVLQCIAHPSSVERDCNTGDTFPFTLDGNRQTGVTSKQGTGSVFMDVMSTARLPSLACSQTHSCSLLVYEDTANGFNPSGLPAPADRVIVPLLFAKSFADCPPVRSFDFRMETETSAAPALYQWATQFCTGAHAFTVDVTNTSSNSARDNFFSNLVDIGVTSVPPTLEERSLAAPTTSKFSVTPLDLTAIAFAYNITDPVSQKRITDLTLTPRLVARLLSDSDLQSFFNDPEFKQLNPHHHWPLQTADPGVRAEKNADTWIVTNWVNGNPAARAFLDGHDTKYHVPVNPAWLHVHYPTDVFAARNSNGVYFPRQGEEGVAQRLFANTKPADSVPTDPIDAGEIGIVDLPTAEQFQLPIAKLTTGVGRPVVGVNALSLLAGFNQMKTSPAGFHTEPVVPSDPYAYPLTKVDHAMVPKRLTHSDKDLRIRAFLDYAVGPGQLALPPGYAALPSALQLQTLRYTGDLPSPPTTTTTTFPAPPIPDVPQGGGSSIDYGSGSPPVVDTTPSTTAVTHPRATTTTIPKVKVKPKRVQLAALHISDAGDRMVLPVVLGLGLLAILASSVDIVRKQGSTFLRRRKLRQQ